MIRDEKTRALINADADALYKYKMERDKARKMVSMQKDIDHLKERVDHLYQLLQNREE